MLKKDISINPEVVTKTLVSFIESRLLSFRRSGAVLGISGGIDSACVAALLRRTTKRKNSLGLIMPERDSGEGTVNEALAIAKTFEIKHKLIDITPVLKSIGIYDSPPGRALSLKKTASRFIRTGYRLFPRGSNPFIGGLLGTEHVWMDYSQAYYRIKNRVRMAYLYYYAELMNYLVVGTANKSEIMVGFFVKYGDGAADIMPIANLYKTQVIELSKYLGVPDFIIKKPPSPDILPGITDELALKISYNKLDLILLGIEKGMSKEEISKETGINTKDISYVQNLVELSEHMRIQPEGP